MAIKPLYSPTSSMESARKGLADAGNTMGKMSKGSTTTTEGPGKTTGGGIMAGVGGAVAGSMLMGRSDRWWYGIRLIFFGLRRLNNV